MKKLIFTLIASLFLAGSVMAKNYSVVLETYTVLSDTTNFAATYPNIAGGAMIDKIVFTTTNTISTPVLITAYDTATSTTAASVDGYWVLSGTTTTGSNTVEMDYPYANPLIYTKPGFFSNTSKATVKVYMTIIYR